MALKNIRVLSLGFLCFMLFNLSDAWAQSVISRTAEGQTEIKPLKIGDNIPEELWQMPLQVVNHPEGRETITLNDYRGKLIILDFWATWCTSCIAAMPQIGKVAEQFGTGLEILFVSSEPARKVEDFLRSNHVMRSLNVMSIAGDTLLRQLFPHASVPHYVWLDQNLSLRAVTASHQITTENISDAISGNTGELINKAVLDLRKPLIIDSPLSHSGYLQYSVLFRGQQRSYGARNIRRTAEGVLYGRAGTNLQLLTLYRTVAGRLMRSMGEDFSQARFLVESQRPERLSYALGVQTVSRDTWNRENLYVFDVTVPMAEAERLDKAILDMLNASSGFHGGIEYRNMPCFVLQEAVKSPATTHGVPVNGNVAPKSTSNIPKGLMLSSAVHLPLVDESGLKKRPELDIPPTAGLPEIRQILKMHGLDLIETERNMAMFVLRDREAQ